ncbi:hypothetical protein UFOVP530_36 [uncultured Caudovirales phage]|uniref:Uncharacterized protein n=1 Tax=uncultured Caudovirales phage TaxID=2100421 RepID=A0A6J5T192_9CAUD|nr:hypothetical protein UFOVP530_36 [uncultured Caudovirales phage]CAB4179097.1 hypothetical protein UFOVP1027_36 [uncultured Caudovirales phage]CAB4188180.1 hypothetical protein UFOVP1182_2 [uncultured Caudovirales phage]CAB4220447.1 hypothetical protein UFOVP1632_18 [uncultured Caudovirales phage]
MNQYSELLRYIKSLAQADILVNTVTKGDFDTLDLDKMNIFPLVHIAITGASFTNGSTVNFSVQVGCFDIRDINKEIRDNKFWEQDNEVDNHNTTLAVLNRMWLKMFVDFEENNITASESPSLDIYTFVRSNTLDGWILSFDVEVPNTTINLCTG